MRLTKKIILISVLIFAVSACESDSSSDSGSSDSSSSGSSGSSSSSGSSTGTRGSCSTSNVCVYYFDMTSTKYTEIKNGCTTATGWMDNTNACEAKIGSSRTQVCQQTASDSKAQTFSYGHTQESAVAAQDSCTSLGGTSNIFNF